MRNQRIDLFKCIAIYDVILVHFKFGLWDWPISVYSRCTVPFFFLVSGYFACRQRGKKLLIKAGHSLGLWAVTLGLVIALCSALVWRQGWSALEYIRQQFSLEGWLDLIIIQCPPFPYAYHIWFIGVMPILYLVWWGITALFARRDGGEVPYRALAVIAIAVLGLHLFLGEGLAILGRTSVRPELLRSAWLDGIPFFLIGAWMRYDEKKITGVLDGKMFLGGLILATALVAVEVRAGGYQELFAGSILMAFLLMAAALKWPEVKQDPIRRWMCFCGSSLTFYIYAIHVPLQGVIVEWGGSVPLFGWIRDHRPAVTLTVAVVSTVAAILLERGKRLLPGRSKKPLAGGGDRHENH